MGEAGGLMDGWRGDEDNCRDIASTEVGNDGFYVFYVLWERYMLFRAAKIEGKWVNMGKGEKMFRR